MILAAADFGEKKRGSRPPPELQLAFEHRRWGLFPEAGGLRDQRAGELDRMALCLNIFNAMRAWSERQGGSEAYWKEKHPEEWEIVMQVRQLRKKRRRRAKKND